MSHPEPIVLKSLIDNFMACTQLQYSGKLDIKSSQGHKWTFYYRLGRIVWATGGTHPWRRWRRHIIQHCPQLDVDKMQFRLEDTSIDYWDYRLLTILHQRQKLTREQIKVAVDNTIAELLFDMSQKAHFCSVECNRNQEVILQAPLNFTNADLSLKLLEDSWKTWFEAGLGEIFPDLAPILRKPEVLEQQVSSSVYKNFVNVMNGKYTLRDLAVKMNHNLLPVTRSLLPYVQKGIIELVEVPDLPLTFAEAKSPPPVNKPKISTPPLIAYVDDSPQACQTLEEIVASKGLRFIQIQDPVNALSVLIQHKPQLIFLDLIMPVVNGYELCAQIRRVSMFSNTPVIILTGSDGLVDRVRAKVVNSTDFISKPVTPDKVMSVVRKYLKYESPADSTSNLQTLPLSC
jgi:chemotaxis family two-component system response regulator PixG